MKGKPLKYAAVLLGIANGAMFTVLGNQNITNPTVKTAAYKAELRLAIIMDNWPGLDQKARKWALRRVKEWRNGLDGADQEMGIGANIAAAYQGVIDLMTIAPPEQIVELERALPYLDELDRFFHVGKSVGRYEHAAAVLKPLYDAIGFEA